MTLPPCSPANSILESELSLAVQQDTLTHLQVMEIEGGFFVMVRLLWAGTKDWYLTTRRDRYQPKVFKDLNRLNEHLKTEYPTQCIRLLRNQVMPPKDKE